jgi:hypothetical protein
MAQKILEGKTKWSRRAGTTCKIAKERERTECTKGSGDDGRSRQRGHVNR